MDIVNISPQVSGSSIYQGATQATAKAAVQASAPTDQTNAAKPAAVPPTADDARLAEVKKAAQSVQSNYYVVSDVRFTIFKDIAGDYVTRFTSLKDGKVTYYPQKSLFELMKIKRAQDAAIFHTEV